ncbi:hypothetical protein [Mycoplasma suis]|uniref:Uncharacterized protein n=1 Tax=Mycoplasma suis (strain Illinois) TaxID=768700 RepID=F0QQX5_MYCSL|nr:hypothetical protein [Mycoplasma suis]ADX97895.1 Conserved hypothetical protein [Mycoplasma suis str. Illinois]
MVILKSKGTLTNAGDTGSWATLSASSPIFLTFFFLYVHRSFKENYGCKELIKPERMKYFHSGLVSSFCLFGLYLILWIVAWKTSSEIAWYVALPLVMILGVVTLVYLSLYEFCIAFDVMYSQNKKELVHNLLERVAGKKIEIVEEEEGEEMEE